jgi:hypothetical protein
MNIWIQMFDVSIYLIAAVFIGVALGTFLWFRYFKDPFN